KPPPTRKPRFPGVGHADGSVQARYSHVTAAIRERLMDGLTDRWNAALEARRTLAPGSPVVALHRLLRDGVGE
ncbi:MAG TPA: hypothetical protein VHI50_03975, partial [Micromonosporaceae bacterium]|nr:hypothetical protein [Micromonosporaceae bacterium]